MDVFSAFRKHDSGTTIKTGPSVCVDTYRLKTIVRYIIRSKNIMC